MTLQEIIEAAAEFQSKDSINDIDEIQKHIMQYISDDALFEFDPVQEWTDTAFNL